MKEFAHQLILCIVNTGYSEAVMDAAKAAGARGGTILKARGTGNKEAEKFFKITVQPEKEMVLILVPADIKEAVMHALYKNVGLNTPGQGIAFALPVDNVVGLSNLQVEIDAQQKISEAAKDAEEKAEKSGLAPETKVESSNGESDGNATEKADKPAKNA